MNKTFLALSIIAASSPLLAEEVTTETLVVTANRTAEQKFDVLAPVEVFDRQDIELIDPESLAQLLDRVAGITTVSNGTAGSNTALFVRGSNSDHVLVLVDGVRIGSATLGQKNIGDIPMSMVERVEVIRGPRAALWGSDAIGGVIQIFTRRLDAGKGIVSTQLGSHSLKRFSAAVGLGNDQHSYTIAASTSKSDGFDVLNPDPNGENDDDGYDRQSLSLSGTSQISDDYRIGLSAQFDRGTTQYDSAYGGNEGDIDNHFIQMTNTLALDKGNVKLTLADSIDNNHDNADTRFPGSVRSRFETRRRQVDLLGSFELSETTNLNAGIDWYKEKVSSHQDFSLDSRTAKAAYLVGRYDNAGWKLEGSLRHDKIGDTEGETTRQLAVGYQLADNLLISISNGTAFKAPTFNDLYWPDAFGSIGNPDLKSELADNTELMLRRKGQSYSLELSVYQTDYDHLIEWQFDPDTFYYSPANVDKAKVKGAELTLDMEILGTGNRLSLSHVDAKNQASGEQLLRRPHFSAFYQWNYHADAWDLSFELNYQGKRNDTGGQLPGYTLVNLGLGYRLSEQLDLRAKVNNLADKAYVQAAAWPDAQTAAYPGADRNYSVTLDYRF